MNDISSQLNEHNKQEYPPMHTAEHLLNATMVKMFGCSRSNNAHIERKKSKCDYELPSEPTAQQIKEVEDAVNTIIQQNLAVTEEYTNHEAAIDLDGAAVLHGVQHLKLSFCLHLEYEAHSRGKQQG